MAVIENLPSSLFPLLDYGMDQRKRHKVAESTLNEYLCLVKLIKRSLPDAPVSSFREADIQSFFNCMAGLEYAKSTISQVRLILNLTFRIALRFHMIADSPVTDTFVPAFAAQKEVLPLTVEEESRLRRECISDAHGDHFLFLLETGLRKSEFCALQWSDFNERAHTLTVRVSKTNAGCRTIPLTALALQLLALQSRCPEHNYIFTSGTHAPVTPSSLCKTYLRLRKKAELPTLTNHVCRHTFATRLIENGADPKAVSALLGHTSVAFTLDRYVQAQPEYLASQIMRLHQRREEPLPINCQTFFGSRS